MMITTREFWVFFGKLILKHAPRLYVAPIVGAFRAPWQQFQRVLADVDEFYARWVEAHPRSGEGRTASPKSS